MNPCCRSGPCEELFSPRIAAWNLRDYQRHGLGRLEQRVLSLLPPASVTQARVLEIGGGVGALQAELLKRGAASGEVVELVNAYRPFALELARHAGVADRSSFRIADVLGDPDAVDPADIVMLNRVVCCSAEGPALVAAAAGLTKDTLWLSYPRASLAARWLARVQHAVFRLLGRRFRFYVRSERTILAAAESAGLTVTVRERGAVWEYALLRRTSTPTT